MASTGTTMNLPICRHCSRTSSPAASRTKGSRTGNPAIWQNFSAWLRHLGFMAVADPIWWLLVGLFVRPSRYRVADANVWLRSFRICLVFHADLKATQVPDRIHCIEGAGINELGSHGAVAVIVEWRDFGGIQVPFS